VVAVAKRFEGRPVKSRVGAFTNVNALSSFLACGASRRQLFSDWRRVDSEITAISPVQGNEDNHKVNVENTKTTTEISVSQLQIKQRN